jgi:hypothetical protein
MLEELGMVSMGGVFFDLGLRFAWLGLPFVIPGFYVHYAWMWVFLMVLSDRVE